jgi:hypothetical protein
VTGEASRGEVRSEGGLWSFKYSTTRRSSTSKSNKEGHQLRSESGRSALLGFNALLCLRRPTAPELCTNCVELDYSSWGRKCSCLRCYAIPGYLHARTLFCRPSGVHEQGEDSPRRSSNGKGKRRGNIWRLEKEREIFLGSKSVTHAMSMGSSPKQSIDKGHTVQQSSSPNNELYISGRTRRIMERGTGVGWQGGRVGNGGGVRYEQGILKNADSS